MGGQPTHAANIDRMAGFRSALEEFGLVLEPKMIFQELNTEERQTDALEAALEQKAECLLCEDDRLAFMLLQDLHQRRVQVPEKLKLASLYDSKILLNTVPTITAVQFDSAALGAAACRLLLDSMAGRKTLHQQMRGYQVILRESTK